MRFFSPRTLVAAGLSCLIVASRKDVSELEWAATILQYTGVVLLIGVGSLGCEYDKWVHAPETGHPRFFEKDWAEVCTKTPWWVVPTLWLPVVGALLLYGQQRHSAQLHDQVALLMAGIVVWQGIEYCIHRFVFHITPTTYWAITLHFLLHGCHHKYPMDNLRLVFPPLPASWIASLIWGAVRSAMQPEYATALFAGILLGYVMYDCCHYFIHHGRIGRGNWLHVLQQSHMSHHYRDPDSNFGISSIIFDVLLGTADISRLL